MQDNQYHTKVVQIELLELMKLVHAFLVSKDIRYSLCGGSLLGAIRHNGFIPWDDDIDIMMDRENFEKFIRCIHTDCNLSITRNLWIYRIKKSANDKATVDVFVMDGVPNNFLERKIKVLMIKILQGMMKSKVDYSRYSFFYKTCTLLTSTFGRIFPDSFKYNIYDKISQIGAKRSNYLCGYNDLFKLLNLRYKKNILDYLVLHQFEDTSFYITSEYDSYLTTQYGDWRTPPQEKDRKPIHI